jgi:PhnB protein
MAQKFIPEGYPQLSPYLIVDEPAALIQFIADVFGAKETRRHEDDKGRIAHAEMRIGDAVIMMGGASEAWPAAPAAMYVYVEDTDAAYQRGLAAGATSLQEPADQFYGDRSAGIRDRFGNQWFIGTHLEKVSEEELKRRSDEHLANRAKAAAAGAGS